MMPMRSAYRDELRLILLTGQHPDGRALGRALAARLAAVVGRPLTAIDGGQNALRG